MPGELPCGFARAEGDGANSLGEMLSLQPLAALSQGLLPQRAEVSPWRLSLKLLDWPEGQRNEGQREASRGG